MIFLMHLERCYFSIKLISLLPVCGRRELQAATVVTNRGSSSLEESSKCLKVRFLPRSRIRNPGSGEGLHLKVFGVSGSQDKGMF